jgi:hypothetical protein
MCVSKDGWDDLLAHQGPLGWTLKQIQDDFMEFMDDQSGSLYVHRRLDTPLENWYSPTHVGGRL